MNRDFGYVRVSVCSPEVVVGDPKKNAEAMLEQMIAIPDSDVVVFPELCITGYTCGDLFQQKTLIDEAEQVVEWFAYVNGERHQLIFIGAPVRVNGELFNCAIAICSGEVLAVIPKQHIPNYKEFYEKRWFGGAGPEHVKGRIRYAGKYVPFGIDIMFEANGFPDLKVFAEICEDLFMPIPPSSIACMYGANLIVNLSASPEQVAKAEYRMELVRNQSGRCLAAYAYASAGPSESTTDLVFSGHCIIAESGSTLQESSHIGDGTLNFLPRLATADIDLQRLLTDRTVQDTFGDCRRYIAREYRIVLYRPSQAKTTNLVRDVAAMPFVPGNPATRDRRAAAVFDIQCAALAKRVKHLGFPDINIGISGGLDSTHALLVAHKTFTALGVSPKKLKCVTMPGFGTTDKTKSLATDLMRLLGVSADEIDIRPLCIQMLRDLKHKPFGIDIEAMWAKQEDKASDRRIDTMPLFLEALMDLLRALPADNRQDLVFENVQARARTFYLMSRGFVLGTGDLSEAALGWSTYNGDHMSMYGINFGVPKTLIRFMVNYVADHYYDGEITATLSKIAGLIISPELLPTNTKGEIVQSTESMIGPYLLHDFFLLNFVRYGFGSEKILYLARQSKLAEFHDEAAILIALRTFIGRFFSQQFKRSCVPDGPKVGTVSLSPRGDWRMPSDASAKAWLEKLQ